jgi:hypothetical protein
MDIRNSFSLLNALHATCRVLTRESCFANILELRGILVNINQSNTLEEFKLFYEELVFSSKPNRIRRLRVVTSVK